MPGEAPPQPEEILHKVQQFPQGTSVAIPNPGALTSGGLGRRFHTTADNFAHEDNDLDNDYMYGLREKLRSGTVLEADISNCNAYYARQPDGPETSFADLVYAAPNIRDHSPPAAFMPSQYHPNLLPPVEEGEVFTAIDDNNTIVRLGRGGRSGPSRNEVEAGYEYPTSPDPSTASNNVKQSSNNELPPIDRTVVTG